MAKLELSEETKAGIGRSKGSRSADRGRGAGGCRAAAGRGHASSAGHERPTCARSAHRGCVSRREQAEPAAQAEIGARTGGNGGRIALPALFAARRQSLENSLACPGKHLSGALRHGAGAGGERMRSDRFRSCRAADQFSGADAGAGAGEALRTRHAALCLGKVRRPAELKHPGSAHTRALWAGGCAFPWRRTSVFRAR